MRKMNVLGIWVATLSMSAAPLAGCKKEEPQPVVTTTETGKTAKETPAGEKPATEAPAGEKPATEVPTGEKPATEAPAGENPPEAPTPAPAAGAAPVLKLIEAGAEPRQALRFAPKKGATETAAMTMKMNMNMELQGNKIPLAMPPFIMKMAVDVLDVAESGDFTYKMALKEAAVGEDPTGATNPAVLDQMKSLIGRMAGLGGEATVTSRGAVTASSFTVPPDAPQELKQVMDSMQQSMQQISVPFPEEAVGVGAKWEVTSEISQGPLKIGMLSKFELKSIEGNVVTIGHEIVQTAGAQAMEAPGMPAGTTATLLNLNGSGKGEGVFALDGVLPTTFATAMTLAMSMNVEAAGQKQSISITTDLDMTMKRE